MQPLNSEQVARVEKMLEDGRDRQSVMEAIGCARTTINRIAHGEHTIQKRRIPFKNKYTKKEETVIPVTNDEGKAGNFMLQIDTDTQELITEQNQREAAVIHTAAGLLLKEYTRLTIAEHSDQRRIKTLCEELELYKIMEKESSDALTKLRDDSERTIANLNATIANLNHDLRKANEHGVEIGDLIPVETRDKVNLMLDQAEAIVG